MVTDPILFYELKSRANLMYNVGLCVAARPTLGGEDRLMTQRIDDRKVSDALTGTAIGKLKRNLAGGDWKDFGQVQVNRIDRETNIFTQEDYTALYDSSSPSECLINKLLSRGLTIDVLQKAVTESGLDHLQRIIDEGLISPGSESVPWSAVDADHSFLITLQNLIQMADRTAQIQALDKLFKEEFEQRFCRPITLFIPGDAEHDLSDFALRLTGKPNHSADIWNSLKSAVKPSVDVEPKILPAPDPDFASRTKGDIICTWDQHLKNLKLPTGTANPETIRKKLEAQSCPVALAFRLDLFDHDQSDLDDFLNKWAELGVLWEDVSSDQLRWPIMAIFFVDHTPNRHIDPCANRLNRWMARIFPGKVARHLKALQTRVNKILKSKASCHLMPPMAGVALKDADHWWNIVKEIHSIKGESFYIRNKIGKIYKKRPNCPIPMTEFRIALTEKYSG